MKLQSITECHLLILEVQKAVKGTLRKGRIIPNFKCRHADMLNYVFSGEVIYYYSDGYSVTVHSGEALYIPRGSSYYYDVISNIYEYIYVDFIFQFPNNVAGRGEAFVLDGVESSFQNLLSRLNSKWFMKQTGYYEACMADLYSAYSKLVQAKNARYKSPKTKSIMESCAEYIQNNYSRTDFKISDLNQIANCSDVHLRRMFKDYFDMSPVAYLQNTRIENAIILLDSTDYSIERVAKMVGYNDPYYFSRVFRNSVGCCPSSYRKKND